MFDQKTVRAGMDQFKKDMEGKQRCSQCRYDIPWVYSEDLYRAIENVMNIAAEHALKSAQNNMN